MALPIPVNDNQKGSSFKVEKKVEIWKDDYEWFKSTHNASISWFTNIALHAYRTVCENPSEYLSDLKEATPISISEVAMVKLKEEIDEGEHGDKTREAD